MTTQAGAEGTYTHTTFTNNGNLGDRDGDESQPDDNRFTEEGLQTMRDPNRKKISIRPRETETETSRTKTTTVSPRRGSRQ